MRVLVNNITQNQSTPSPPHTLPTPPPRVSWLNSHNRDKTSLVIFCQSTFEIQTFPNRHVSRARLNITKSHRAGVPLMNMETAHNYFFTYYSCCYNFIIVWGRGIINSFGLSERNYVGVDRLGLDMASLVREVHDVTGPRSLSLVKLRRNHKGHHKHNTQS